ncbi:hypothetical protein GINT2_001551 [Glugoides intestinalis]
MPVIYYFRFVLLDSLTPEDVHETLEQVNLHLEFKNTLINPIFGYLFEKLGFLDNIRYLNPYIKFVDNGNNKYQIGFYERDNHAVPLINLLSTLFSFPRFNILMTEKKNNNLTNLAKDLSFLFVNSVSDKNRDLNMSIFLKSLKINSDMRKSNKELFGSPSLRPIIIHAYALKHLDKPALKVYLELILTKLKIKKVNSLAALKNRDRTVGIKSLGIEHDITKVIIEVERKVNMTPSSGFNLPASHDYFEEVKSQIACPKKVGTLELIIFHFCNHIFKADVIEKINRSLNPFLNEFITFYQQYDRSSPLTVAQYKIWDEILKKLLKLPDGKEENQKIEILYTKEDTLESGFLNMVLALRRIFRVENTPNCDFFCENPHFNLEEAFNTTLKTILENLGIITIKIKVFFEQDNCDLFMCPLANRLFRAEIMGNLRVEFKYDQGENLFIDSKAIIQLYPTSIVPSGFFHTHVDFKLDSSTIKTCREIIQHINRHHPEDLEFQMLIRYFTLAIYPEKVIPGNLMHSFYMTGRIVSSKKKISLLKMLYKEIYLAKFLKKKIEERTVIHAMLLINTLLKSVMLDDQTFPTYIQPFIPYNAKVEDTEFCIAWCNILRYGYKPLIKIWNERAIYRRLNTLALNIQDIRSKHLEEVLGICRKFIGVKVFSITDSLSEDLDFNDFYYRISLEIINRNKATLSDVTLCYEKTIPTVANLSRDLLNAVCKLQGLKKLHIMGYDVTFKDIFDIIKSVKSLKTIKISGNINQCKDSIPTNASESIKQDKNLKSRLSKRSVEITFSDLNVTGNTISFLCNILNGYPELYLKFSNVNLDFYEGKLNAGDLTKLAEKRVFPDTCTMNFTFKGSFYSRNNVQTFISFFDNLNLSDSKVSAPALHFIFSDNKTHIFKDVNEYISKIPMLQNWLISIKNLQTLKMCENTLVRLDRDSISAFNRYDNKELLIDIEHAIVEQSFIDYLGSDEDKFGLYFQYGKKIGYENKILACRIRIFKDPKNKIKLF